jgi:uncharacterized circularly permuted ATP-grasp superfamily protein/uncharacterized alpha-E superfamily protein
VTGHPGYLRPLVGVVPPGGVYLHIVAFDLARAPDGNWWVVSQRTQAPSGLGYTLENRMTVSRLFPDAFRELRTQHLASCYRTLLETLYRLSPGEGEPRIVLLTPGPFNETYFEHAYLARYLGLTLVEGGDLTVRDDKLYLKTLYGLERVHAVLRRLDDDYCDPVELRSESTIGVPGLAQVVRAGNVLLANALGSGFLESPGINGFLPAIARRLLGGPLALPSLASWWCGEKAARDQVLDLLPTLVTKPTYPSADFEPMIGADASEAQIAALKARIAAAPDAYTVQSYLPLSHAPAWSDGHLVPRAAMVRVFAIADGAGGWQVLPGGLTRIASRDQFVVSMQRGGSSLDTWVLSDGPVDAFSLLPDRLRPDNLADKRRLVSSRAAENLFWMGRYAERAESAVRLVKLTLIWLNGDDEWPAPFGQALARLCMMNGLVAAGVPSPAQARRVFERAMVAGLSTGGESGAACSVGYDLQALAGAAGQIRDRLSPEHWRFVRSAGQDFEARLSEMRARDEYSAAEALRALDALATQMAAITGAQTDRMTRDDGWRLMAVGRQIERLTAIATALAVFFDAGVVHHESGFDMLLGIADSTITYRAHYQRRLEVPALLDLLVMDADNPRALACILGALRAELARLPGAVPDLLGFLPAGIEATLADLCAGDGAGRHPALQSMLESLIAGARGLSDEIGSRYFSHVQGLDQALAA